MPHRVEHTDGQLNFADLLAIWIATGLTKFREFLNSLDKAFKVIVLDDV